MHLRRDLFHDPLDVEEIDRPLRIAPERSDRAVEDDGDAMMFSYMVVGCRLSVVRPADFEQRAVACAVGAIEGDRFQQTGKQRQAHRLDCLGERIRDRDRCLIGDKRVPLRADEGVIDGLGQAASDQDVANRVFGDIRGFAAYIARGHARQCGRNVVETEEAEHFLDQICLFVNVASIRRYRDAQTVVNLFRVEAEAAEELQAVSDTDGAGRSVVQFRRTEADRLRRHLPGDDVNRCLGGAAAAIGNHPRRFRDHGQSVVGIDAALEPVRGVRLHAQPPRGAPDRRWIEPGTFEHHIARRRGDLRLEAAHDPAESDGALRVGDDDGIGIDLAHLTIETLHRLAWFSPANDDGVPADAIEVEGVQGMAEGDHHVVGDVDNVVDRAEADRFEAPCHQWRGWLHGDVADDHSGVARAHLRRFDADRWRRERCQASWRRCRPDRRSSQCGGQLAGHAEVRHRINAVGGDLEIEDGVVAMALGRFHGVSDFGQAD